MEAGLENFQVDPSQGTHFFQNLTSLGVGYLTIDAFRGNGKYDCSLFEGLPVVQETEYVAHVRLSEPLTIKIDGMKKEAVVLMPKELLEPKAPLPDAEEEGEDKKIKEE